MEVRLKQSILFLSVLSLQLFCVCCYIPCASREVEYGYVCVCNSTYCDTVPQIEPLSTGQYQIYTTSKNNLGFSSSVGAFSSSSNSTASVQITVANLSDTHQTIIGFGGAFSDSTGINVLSLSEEAQQLLLESYFGEEGLEYTLGRVPIGGTDFSTKAYTYCDGEDLTLEEFTLADEDYSYKLPLIKKAIDLKGDKQLLLLASAWSSPAWTKSTNSIKGSGNLKEEYYDWWAKYFIKFFEAYESNGVIFWAVTTQNEPVQGFLATDVPNLRFSFNNLKTWIKDYFGPTIRNSTFKDLKIITYDDGRDFLPLLQMVVLSDEEVLEYIDGVGVHWYTDFFIPASFLNYAKSDKKDLFVIGTEASNGFLKFFNLIPHVMLGNWARGVNYINNIFDDLEYGMAGWIDWNMALDPSGGPTFIDNFVDSPIIVNSTSGEFYKQPMFYALGHFSKFVLPDSVRVTTEVSSSKIRTLAFNRPDDKTVLIISNDSDDDVEVDIVIESISSTINIQSKSINSLLIKL
ncbi:lysosomal acid glucosylceramidase-like [Rhynchophorus ferrugineus]|uniref:lysosomal acid glucosylceramidase-like n=1 Tax=Rhynchophorus ferrugineus TaxID=354439 RepID=UPI003FCE9DB0